MVIKLLDGIRVLDFTWAIAGPHCTGLLAALGAQVIHVGTEGRQAFANVPELDITNLGKYSISLNLRQAEALEVAKDLVGISDVVVENFRPGAMKRLGLGYDDIRKLRPDIIMISGSGFGSTGPEAQYAAFAPMFGAMSSLGALTGYANGIPSEIRMTPDYTGGTFMVLAIIAALQHRRLTGKGQFLDLSFRESLTCLFGEVLMDATVNRSDPSRSGNSDGSMAPHGVYRCHGDDAWISVVVKTDEEWQSLVQAMGSPAWAMSENFSRVHDRLAHQDELDSRINEWTANFTPEELMTALQHADVAAVPSFSVKQICEDPHLRDRQLFSQVSTDQDSRVSLGTPWVIDGERPLHPPRAPHLGADNDFVFLELLGLSDSKMATLYEQRAIR